MHPQAAPAAEAAECAADQGKYWEMHDLLFEKQSGLASADFVAWARELGLDAAAFEECVKSGVKRTKVTADGALADLLEARGTPTLFLGRMRADGGVDLLKRISGAVPLQMMLEEVAEL